MKKTHKPTAYGRNLARVYRSAAKMIRTDSRSVEKSTGCCYAIGYASSICRFSPTEAKRLFCRAMKKEEEYLFWWPTINSIYPFDGDDETFNRCATPRIIALELAALMAEEGQLV